MKLCHCFVVTLCDDGTESSKNVTMRLYQKKCQWGYSIFTILSNLALGHEIDRHFWKGVELK